MFHKFRSFFLFLARGINALLPEHTRRMIFWASLCGYIKGENQIDKATLDKLNTLMDLCIDEKALNLPVALNKVIWSDKFGADLLSATVYKEQDKTDATTVERFIKSVPAWMLYSNVDKIRKDTLQLLGHREILV